MVSGTSYQQTRDSIGSEPETFPLALRYFRNLLAYQTIRTTKKNISGGSVYGSPIYGLYGNASYTSTALSGFVLGHPSYGILGTSQLGTPVAEEIIVSVKNNRNIFYDILDTDDFINTTNSTGTFTSGSYTLDSGEILQSNIIAANNTLYTKATLTVTGTGLDDDTLYLSADGGTTWEGVTNNIEHTFTNNSTDGIKYKIVGGTTSSLIETVKVKYQ